jgi:hypothetical protein
MGDRVYIRITLYFAILFEIFLVVVRKVCLKHHNLCIDEVNHTSNFQRLL